MHVNTIFVLMDYKPALSAYFSIFNVLSFYLKFLVIFHIFLQSSCYVLSLSSHLSSKAPHFVLIAFSKQNCSEKGSTSEQWN